MRNKSRVLFIVGVSLSLVFLLAMLSVAVVGASPASDVAKGKAAFDKNCAACHGEAGKGGIGPPLGKDVSYFVNAGLPTQLMGPLLSQSVRQRPPGAKMPAFGPDKVSDADLADIGDYLFSLTPPPSAPPKLGTAGNGAKPYADNCAACHGAKGEGGSGPPVAMMAAGFKQMGAPPNIMLAFVNLAARSGTLPKMPTFAADKLSDAQLADIAAYIWSIAPSGPPAGAAAGGSLPKAGEPVAIYLLLAAAASAALIGGVLLGLRTRRI